ncbi:MAG TPA: hypothetical protein VFH88_07160 [Candidatus Krumholzibacteria bacterium]|nr:hypothetical protein [Candidatus Krumholzibacteria bacterium]
MMARWIRILVCAAALLLPAMAPGEIVTLKDASTVRGRLIQVDGDTLVFRSSFGTLRFHRNQVISIVFDDSVQAMVTAPVSAPAGAVRAPGGQGRIEVVFRDRRLSSKIAIDLKKDWDGHVAANHIITEFRVEGHVAYSAVDTTMDKRIYKGHTTIMKNDVELADFGVNVPAGIHQTELVVRNADGDAYRGDFDPGPLDLTLPVDNVDVRPGEIYRINVAISRGKLKMGQPRLVRIQ